MANENFIEDLKTNIVNSIDSQRDKAKNDFEDALKELKAEFEKRKFELQDEYVRRISGLNRDENRFQMSDFFTLSDITNALSQMISNAEGERYTTHKTSILDENGNVSKTVVSFVKEEFVDGIDETIVYKHSMHPECVKMPDTRYVYLTEYTERELPVRSYFYGITRYEDSEVYVTFNPHNTYLDSKHVLARISDPHFDYVNSFMDGATKTKMLSGFEKSDDFAQLAIIQGVDIYKKNHPGVKKGRIRLFSNKK